MPDVTRVSRTIAAHARGDGHAAHSDHDPDGDDGDDAADGSG
jgi:hypothetical protein